ncbi:biopolymer transporter ExbD [Deltaproteobacteria bacterium TL4]
MKKRLRSTHRLKEDLVSEINITPFVDILLVLLIAFMVSAPLVTHSLLIELPQGELKESETKPENDPLPVAVDVDLNISLAEQQMSFAELEAHLPQMSLSDKKRPVYLQMDKRVPHGFLIKLMLIFKNSGFKQVGLVFSEEDDKTLPDRSNGS